MGTRCKTAATPPTTMNRTSWRVRTSISLRNRFSNSLHTFGKLMHLLECLQALERRIAEASTHEASIHAVVVVLFARWSLVFEVCRHALQLTRSGRPSSSRTSRPRKPVPGAVAAAAQRVSLLRGNGATCSTKTQRSDPPPRAARFGAASGVEGPGRAQRLQRREHDRPHNDAHRKEQPFESTGARQRLQGQ